MPIKAYSVVQIGAKAQLGGVQAGFASVVYHEETLANVKNPPATPTSSQTIMQESSFKMSVGFIYFTNITPTISKTAA